VDKTNFLHRLKGLAAVGCAAQSLYRACTECAQIWRDSELLAFCTFAPVDMQAFVHSGCCLGCRQAGWSRCAAREQRCQDLVEQGFEERIRFPMRQPNSSSDFKKKLSAARRLRHLRFTTRICIQR